MPYPGQGNVSGTARLMLGAPSYAVGWQVPAYPPDPAAGAGFTYTVDGRYYERLISASFRYTASAVAANRYPQLSIQDANSAFVLAVPTVASIVAGNNLTVSLSPFYEAQTLANGAVATNQLPDMLMPPGWNLNLIVTNIDPGDQVSQIVLVVQRFPTDAIETEAGA